VTGPIVGQDGKEVLAKDAKADDKFLGGIKFYVKGVEGKVPGDGKNKKEGRTREEPRHNRQSLPLRLMPRRQSVAKGRDLRPFVLLSGFA
jgi:hypothetical protein